MKMTEDVNEIFNDELIFDRLGRLYLKAAKIRLKHLAQKIRLQRLKNK